MPDPFPSPDNSPRRTEKPERPARPPVTMSLLGPLLAGFAGGQGSLRRYLMGAITAALLTFNHRLGLNLSIEEQAIIAGLVSTIVIASNTKEAAVSRARVRAEADVVKAQQARGKE